MEGYDRHMKVMTEKRFNREMARIKVENQRREWNKQLREERRKGRPSLKLPTTSKLVLVATMIICVWIVAFCMWMMYETRDTSSMYVLIGIPVAMAPTIWSYYSKAKAENTAGGITYETAMLNNINNDITLAEGVNTSGDCEG